MTEKLYYSYDSKNKSAFFIILIGLIFFLTGMFLYVQFDKIGGLVCVCGFGIIFVYGGVKQYFINPKQYFFYIDKEHVKWGEQDRWGEQDNVEEILLTNVKKVEFSIADGQFINFTLSDNSQKSYQNIPISLNEFDKLIEFMKFHCSGTIWKNGYIVE